MSVIEQVFKKDDGGRPLSLLRVVEATSRQVGKSLEEILNVVPDPDGEGKLWYILYRDSTFGVLELGQAPVNWQAAIIKDMKEGGQ